MYNKRYTLFVRITNRLSILPFKYKIKSNLEKNHDLIRLVRYFNIAVILAIAQSFASLRYNVSLKVNLIF